MRQAIAAIILVIVLASPGLPQSRMKCPNYFSVFPKGAIVLGNSSEFAIETKDGGLANQPVLFWSVSAGGRYR